MAQAISLSPALFNVLIANAANGSVRPANLVSNIQTNTPYTFKDRKAQFRKEAPGRFTVEMFKEGARRPVTRPVAR